MAVSTLASEAQGRKVDLAIHRLSGISEGLSDLSDSAHNEGRRRFADDLFRLVVELEGTIASLRASR